MLENLIALLTRLIVRSFPLAKSNPNEWRNTMANLLARYHSAAMMVGTGKEEMSEEESQAVAKMVNTQLKFLDGFTLDVEDEGEFLPKWEARAKSYANSIKQPYWAGKTEMLPIPALPGDGTSQCLGNCTCKISVQKLAGEGNYNVTWLLGEKELEDKDKSRHCQTCKIRAKRWNPLKIRDSELATEDE